MKNPNPNLWSVSYTCEVSENTPDLWILAPSAGSAEKKARRVLKKLGERRVRITSVRHKGTIDAF